MSLHRFFSQEILPDTGTFNIILSPEELHHFHVLRIQTHEHFELFDQQGTCLEVELLKSDNHAIQASIVRALEQEWLPHLTLVQGLSKSEHMTQTIRQCTELGIERIVPFLSERSIVRLTDSSRNKKQQRYAKIALSAAKQCGRSNTPKITDILNTRTIAQTLNHEDCILLAWEEDMQQSLSIADALAPFPHDAHVALLIGPEGGFSKEETDYFRKIFKERLKTIQMGPLIMRTQTAATVCTALASACLGGMGFHD